MPLLNNNDQKNEIINGVIYDMSPSAGFSHMQVNGNIYTLIRNSLKSSVCAVSMENLDLYLSEDEYVIPDIMILCDRSHIKHGKYSGIPRFIVETLSPSTALKDRTVKKEKYAQLGVDEYWIVDSRGTSIEIYYLKETKYELVNALILDNDPESPHYNAETLLTLRAFPSVSMKLQDIFEGIENS